MQIEKNGGNGNGKNTAAGHRSRGRPKSREGGSRVHIFVQDSMMERLLELQEYSHASSITEVIKNALQLYAAAVHEHKSGSRLCFKDDEGERQLLIFYP
jgi:hypothetical protein